MTKRRNDPGAADALLNGVGTSENVGVSEARKGSPTFSHPGAVTGWVMIQLGALGLGAGQVAMWDEGPRPVERVALAEMVIVQAGAAGMLFPVLFRNVGTTVALVASTWPFLQLAGMLSATPGGRVVGVGIYVTMWMAALALLSSVLHSERARLRAVAGATSLVFAGPLLSYVRHEFDAGADGGASAGAIGAVARASPVVGALDVLNSENRSAGVWVWMSAMLVVALVISIVMRRGRRTRDKLSTEHPQGLPTGARSDAGF